MSVYRQFLGILKRNGRSMTLKHEGESLFVRAYIAPFTYSNREYLNDRYSIIGSQEQNSFLYLGSPEDGGSLMSVGDLIYDGDEGYRVTVCELRRLADQPFYVWGILRRANEEAENG